MNTSKVGTNFGFVAWFFLTASAVVVAFLSLTAMPDFSSASGYGVFLAIPNLGIILVCGLLGAACFFLHPKFSDVRRSTAICTASSYALLLAALFSHPAIWGACTIHVQIVEPDRRPISGITIDTLRQNERLDIRSGFQRNDVKETVTTDAAGRASIDFNRYQRMSGHVNMQMGGKAVNSDYRTAGFDLLPQPGGANDCCHPLEQD